MKRLISLFLVLTMLLSNGSPILTTAFANELEATESEDVAGEVIGGVEEVPEETECAHDGGLMHLRLEDNEEEHAVVCSVCHAYLGAEAHTYGEDGKCPCGVLIELSGPASGTIGENMSWQLDAEGTLVISGEGEMLDNVSSDDVPWAMYRDAIVHVEIEEGVTSIASASFFNCHNLTDITIAGSVQNIGLSAFSFCTSLIEMIVPEGVTTLELTVFHGCTSLEYAVLPDSLVNLGEGTFQDCVSMKAIDLPDNLQTIGKATFRNCSALETIVVPASVTTIGKNAFRDCSSLSEIYFEGDAPAFNSNIFQYVTAKAYYPANNDTWTADVMQNYGGTITWVAYGEPDNDEPTVPEEEPTEPEEEELIPNLGYYEYIEIPAGETLEIPFTITEAGSYSFLLSHYFYENRNYSPHLDVYQDGVSLTRSSYSWDDYSSVTVDLEPGEYTIIWNANDYDFTYPATVSYGPTPAPENVTVCGGSGICVDLAQSKTGYLYLKYEPEFAPVNVASWFSSNTDVATVYEENGSWRYQVQGAGETVITAFLDNDDTYSATFVFYEADQMPQLADAVGMTLEPMGSVEYHMNVDSTSYCRIATGNYVTIDMDYYTQYGISVSLYDGECQQVWDDSQGWGSDEGNFVSFSELAPGEYHVVFKNTTNEPQWMEPSLRLEANEPECLHENVLCQYWNEESHDVYCEACGELLYAELHDFTGGYTRYSCICGAYPYPMFPEGGLKVLEDPNGQDFIFVAGESGTYELRISNYGESAVWAVIENEESLDWQDTEDGRVITYSLEEGMSYWVSMYDELGLGEATVTIEKVGQTGTWQLGEEVEVWEFAYRYETFIAPETGWYVVETPAVVHEYTEEMWDENGSWLETRYEYYYAEVTGPDYFRMVDRENQIAYTYFRCEQGEGVKLELYGCWNGAGGTYSLTLNKAGTPEYLELAGDTYPIYLEDGIWNGVNAWYKCMPYGTWADVTWETDDPEYFSASDMRMGCQVNAYAQGSTTVTGYIGENQVASFQVVAQSIPVIEEGVEYSDRFTGDSTMYYYYFTPGESGTYVVTTPLAENGSLCVAAYCDAYGYVDQETVNGTYAYQYKNLEAGVTYRIEAYHYNWGTMDTWFRIDKVPEIQELTLSYNELVVSAGEIGSGYEISVTAWPESALRDGIAWTSSNEAVAVVNWYDADHCGFEICGEGTAEIIATAPNGVSASCTVTVKGYPEMTVDTRYDITLEAWERTTYSFTPNETGYYNIYSYTYTDGNGNNSWLGVSTNDGSDGTGGYAEELGCYIVSYYLQAGTEYNVDVWNDVDLPFTGTVEIHRAVPAENVWLSNSEINVSLVPGEPYEFHNWVNVDYWYNKVAAVSWVSDNEDVLRVVSSDINFSACQVIGVGNANLIVTLDDDRILTVPVTASEMTDFDGSEEITLNAYSRQEYLFTPVESGYYNVKSAYAEEPEQGYGAVGFDAQMETSEGYWVSVVRTNQDYENGYCLRTYYLEANTRYRLCVANELDFAMSRQVDVYLAPAAAGITLDYEGGDLYRTESDFESGIVHFMQATFEPVDAFMELTWTSSNEDVIQIWSQNSGGCDWRDVAYGEATLTAATVDGSMSASVTYNVRDLPKFDEDGDTLESVTVKPSNVRSYYYTPAESGYYSINTYFCSNEFGGRYRLHPNVYNSEGVYVGNKAGFDCGAFYSDAYYLEAGEKYQVQFGVWEDMELTADVQIIPTSAPTQLTFHQDDFTIYWDSESGETYSSELYTSFLPEGSFGDLSWSVSDEKILSIRPDESNNPRCYYDVVGYGTATITASCGDVSHSINITVAGVPELLLGQDEEVTLNPWTSTYYTFTPETTGWYNLSCRDGGYCDFILYAEGTDCGGSDVTVKLEGGREYRINVSNDCEWVHSGTVRISEALKLESFSFDPAEVTVYWDGSSESWYYQGPNNQPYNAGFDITWSQDTYEYLQIEGQRALDYKPTGFGTTVVTAEAYDGENTYTATLTVHVVPIPELSLEKTGSLVIYPELPNGGYVEYTLTTDVSGYHVLYAPYYRPDEWNSYEVLHCDIIDSQGNYAEHVCSDYPENGKRQVYNLVAGERYRVRLYNYDLPTQTYEIYIGKAQQPAELILNQNEVNVTWIEGYDQWIYLRTQADDIYSYGGDVSWSVSGDGVVELASWGNNWADFRAIGYGTVTVTATCGEISASCVVTVESLPELEMGTNEIPLPSGQEPQYIFIPETTGWYKFYVPSVYINEEYTNFRPNFEVTADGGWPELEWGNDNEGEWEYCLLYAGRTYNLRLWQYTGYDCIAAMEISMCDPLESAEVENSEFVITWDGISDQVSYNGIRLYPETAFDKLYWTSDNEAVAYPRYWGGYEVGVRPTGYGEAVFTGTTENGITASFKVIVRAPEEIKVGESKEITIPAGASLGYSFNPTESGWYTLTFPVIPDEYGYICPELSIKRIDENGSEYVSWSGYIDSDAWTQSYTFWAEADMRYSLTLDNSFYAIDQSGTLTLSPAAEAEGISIQEQRNFWFDPNGETQSEYVNYDIIPGNAMTDVTIHIEDESIVTLDGHDNENTHFWLLPVGIGETTVTLTTDNGHSATMNVSVQERPALEWLEAFDRTGLVGEMVSVHANIYPEGALADLEFTVGDPTVAQIEGSWYNGCDLRLLKEGTTTITSTDRNTGISATATVTAVVPAEIIVGHRENVTLPGNDSAAYFLFTPDQTDTYLLTSVSNNWRYSYFDIQALNGDWPFYDSMDSDGTTRCYAQLQAGVTYRIALHSGEAGMFSFSLETAPELSSIAFERSEYTLYYTDYESVYTNYANLFLVKDPVDGYDSIANVYDSNGLVEIGFANSQRIGISYHGTGDTTVTVVTASGKTAQCELHILPAPPVESLEFEVYSNGLFLPGTMVYGEVRSWPEGSYAVLNPVSSGNPDVAQIYHMGGREFQVEILNYGTTALTFVDEQTGVTLDYVLEVKEPKSVELGWSESLTLEHQGNEPLTFTPAESGWYMLTTEYSEMENGGYGTFGFNVSDAFGRYCESHGVYYNVDEPGRVFTWLEADTAYNIAVRNFSESTLTSRVGLAKAETVTGFRLEMESWTVAQRGYEENQWYTVGAEFTPHNAFEPIDWTLTGDTDAILVRWTDGRYFEFSAMEPGTVTLTASTESGWTDSTTITVEPATELELDTPISVEVQPGWDNPATVAFTPSESGRYCFTAERSEDSWFYLSADGGWNNIAYLYSDMGNHVFMDCEAGRTYYLDVINEGNVAADATVYVEKAVEATGFTLAYGTGFEGDVPYAGIEPRFTPYNSADPIVNWEVQDNGILLVRFQNEYNLSCEVIGNGEVTVTATTASGLTASVTFFATDGTDLCPDGHTPESVPGIEATCTESGLTEGSVCSVCGRILTEQEIIPALGHDYTVETVEPTCTEAGSTTYTCNRCIKTYTEEIGALGHDYRDEFTEPTCTQEGYNTRICNNCGDSYISEWFDKYAHNTNAVVTDPTCTADGYTTYTCVDCGDVRVDVYVDPLASQFESSLGILGAWGLFELNGEYMLERVKYQFRDYLPEDSEGFMAMAVVPAADFEAVLDQYFVMDEEKLAMIRGYEYAGYDAETQTYSFYPYGGMGGILNQRTYVGYAALGENRYDVYFAAIHYDFLSDHLPEDVNVWDYAESLGYPSQIEYDGIVFQSGPEGYYTIVSIGDYGKVIRVDVKDGIARIDTMADYTAEDLPEHFSDRNGAALGHNIVTVDSKEPTCTEPGLTEGKHCDRCGEILTAQEEIPAPGHSAVEVPGFAATCIDPGMTDGLVCDLCGEILVAQETIEPLGHVEIVDPAVEPTCTETGLTEGKHCERCGEILIAQETVEAKGHDGFIIKGYDPTCTEDGLTDELHCGECDAVLTAPIVIPALGHKEVIDPAVEPTCTEDGLTEGSHCERCGEILVAQETVEAKGHVIGVTGSLPTCTEPGMNGFGCANCDYYYEEHYEPLGHDYEAVITAPTCTEQGYTTYTCVRENFGEICGHTYVDDYTEALGHVYNEETQAPTCTEPGQSVFNCERCGDSYAVEIEPLGHDYTTVTVAPSCTEEGYTLYTCQRCDESHIDEIVDALGHSYTAALTPATCTTDGFTTYTCGICGDSYTADVVPAFGHNYEAVVVDPTCTEGGYTTYTCVTCFSSYIGDEVPPKGHSYVDGICECGEYQTEGQYGENITWSFDAETGTLTVSGTGAMPDAKPGDWLPWSHLHPAKGLPSIKKVIVEEGITTVGGAAFFNNMELTSVELPATITSIGDNAFMLCTALTDLELPENLTHIGQAAFWNTSLTSVTIPAGVTVIPVEAFRDVATLESVTFLGDVTRIEMDGFSGCSSLTEIELPESVTYLGTYAFAGCASLTEITIPASVTTVGMNILSSCDALTAIYFRGDAPTLEDGNYPLFDDVNVYIPAGNETWTGEYRAIIGPNATWIDKCIDGIHSEIVEEGYAPTCTEPGLTDKIFCAVCGEILTAQEEIPALGHNYNDWVKEPGCTESGCTVHECTNCGERYEDNFVEALGHDIVIDPGYAPTCTEEGLTEGSHCSRCAEMNVLQDPIPALGHKEVIDEAKDVTCTEPGLTEGVHCDRCGEILTAQEEIPALGHDLTHNPEVLPNCYVAGYKEFWICERCGSHFTDVEGKQKVDFEDLVLPSPGHDYQAVTTVPTCTTDGYTTYTCDRCGDSYIADQIPAFGHTVEIDPSYEPTCTRGGLTEGSHCSVCFEILTEQEEIPALGHDVIIDETVEATCTENGLTEGQHCGRCHEILVKQEVIPATGHDLVENTGKKATCTEAGILAHWSCEACGKNFTDDTCTTELTDLAIPALGHELVKVESSAPTYSAPGNAEYYICAVCHRMYTDETASTETNMDEVRIPAKEMGKLEIPTPEYMCINEVAWVEITLDGVNTEEAGYDIYWECDRPDVLQVIYENGSFRLRANKEGSATISVLDGDDWAYYTVVVDPYYAVNSGEYEKLDAGWDWQEYRYTAQEDGMHVFYTSEANVPVRIYVEACELWDEDGMPIVPVPVQNQVGNDVAYAVELEKGQTYIVSVYNFNSEDAVYKFHGELATEEIDTLRFSLYDQYGDYCDTGVYGEYVDLEIRYQPLNAKPDFEIVVEEVYTHYEDVDAIRYDPDTGRVTFLYPGEAVLNINKQGSDMQGYYDTARFYTQLPDGWDYEAAYFDGGYWTFDGSVLGVYAEYDIPDFENPEDAPWYGFMPYVDVLKISGYANHIGTNAFADLNAVEMEITMGDWGYIAMNAFTNCRRLSLVTFYSDPYIEQDGFTGFGDLQFVIYGEGHMVSSFAMERGIDMYTDGGWMWEDPNDPERGGAGWGYDGDDGLHIWGDGDMWFDDMMPWSRSVVRAASTAPWAAYADRIKSVTINNGITSIPDSAFAGLTQVEEILIPASVETVGENAFATGSESLTLKIAEGGNAEAVKEAVKDSGAEIQVVPTSGEGWSISGNELTLTAHTTEWREYHADAIASVHLGAGVTGITAADFAGCANLATFTAEGETYTAVKGQLIENGKLIVVAPALTKVILDAGVTEIAQGAIAEGVEVLKVCTSGLEGYETVHTAKYVAGIQATCEKSGRVEHYNCSACGKNFADQDCTEEIENTVLPMAHSMTYTEAKAPTCTDKGNVEYWSCELCEKNFADEAGTVTLANVEIRANGHAMTAVAAVNPTCTENGLYAHWICGTCGEYFLHADGHDITTTAQDVVKPALGHKWTEASCTEPKTCETCGETEGEALGHDWTDATCTEPKTCKTCGETEGEALEHKYGPIGEVAWDDDQNSFCAKRICSVCEHEDVRTYTVTNAEVIKAATCTEPGETIYTAVALGLTVTERVVTKALGHTEEVIPAVSATCTTTGLTEGKKCSVCGETLVAQTETPARGHTEEVISAVPATCTATGLTEGKKCSVCGEILVAQKETEKLAHSFGDWVITKQPTEEAEGEETRTCICGETEKRILAKLDPSHVHNYKAVVTKPTCTEGGYTTYTCECGESYVDNKTAALGHTEVIDKAVGATCTADGKTGGKHCSVCGETLVKQEVVKAKGHTEVIDGAVEATCAAEGKTEGKHCSVCGEILVKQETVAKLAHTWGNWTIKVNPSSTTEGKREHTCAVCKTTESQVINKLSGAFTDVVDTDYFAVAVDWAVQKEVTNGIGAGLFGPAQDCTRAQVVTFLWRAAGSPEPASGNNPFKDVDASAWYGKAVLWAVEMGITNGMSDDEFGTDLTCTRAQVATFLWRAQGKPVATGKNPFVDVKSGEYYYEAVIWAVENGVTTGTSETTFDPNATCTRGQIVTFLYRAIA